MNFSKYFVFVAAAVLVVFARQSQAGILSTVGGALATIGSAAVNIVDTGLSAFVQSFEEALAEGRQHRNTIKAKENLEAEFSKSNGNTADVIIAKGFIPVIDDVAASVDTLYDALKEAQESNNRVAPDEIEKKLGAAFDAANELIVSAGARAFNVLGAATVESKPGATKGLNLATLYIQYAGDQSFVGYGSARSLAMQGLQAQGDADEQALVAAVKAIQMVEKLAYQLIAQAVQTAYAALANESAPAVEDAKLLADRESAAEGSPKCQNAIKAIEEAADKALAAVINPAARQAILYTRNGLITLCKIIASAGQPGYNAALQARNIDDKDAATKTIKDGCEESRKICFVAVSTGQQNLGAAAHLAGEKAVMPLINAMILLEKARTDLLNGIDNAAILGTMAIRTDLKDIGLRAAYDAIATAGFSGYSYAVQSANVAFDAILAA
ncbi:uncharacterized protein LOC129913387 [Episyrphus balteatus]|uniref:uncharacterized protein LOC129913387 n=1 Tax=Episyrphus balteatus TaxID=286459 RepID=UPI0024869781|nr:uncharacterized protein LOC129913387 [Episyrphus balteatus]